MQLYVTLDKQSPCCKNITNCRDFLFVYNSIVHKWKIAQVFSSSISILPYASVFSSRVGKSGSIHSNDQEKWINIDVFKSVFKWKSSTRRRNNYGFMVKLANEEQALSLLSFASHSHANIYIRPTLHVCLTVLIW